MSNMKSIIQGIKSLIISIIITRLVANAQSASDFGYRICYAHYPPVIMLQTGMQAWECPKCGVVLST